MVIWYRTFSLTTCLRRDFFYIFPYVGIIRLDTSYLCRTPGSTCSLCLPGRSSPASRPSSPSPILASWILCGGPPTAIRSAAPPPLYGKANSPSALIKAVRVFFVCYLCFFLLMHLSFFPPAVTSKSLHFCLNVEKMAVLGLHIRRCL
jgi:hypothetical protein